jgi:IS5 family transposase
MALSNMFRIYCLQNWFNLSDRQMEDALYEIESMRRFAGFSGVTDTLPDETTILNFRHLLEKHELTVVLLEAINAHLKAQGLLVSNGTMVDATIIHSPSSTRNQEQGRDPEMHQTKKGKQWYFGMKVHVGADVDSGAVHTVEITAANEADINVLPKLLRADEECCPGEHADGLGQPVSAAQAAVDYLRGESAQNTLTADDEAQTGGIWRQNAAGK